VRSDSLCGDQSLVVGHRLHSLLSQTLESGWVFAKIQLSANKDDGNIWRMVIDFREPLGSNVVKGWRADDREANEEDIGLGVRQRTKSIIILLSSSIPKAERDWLAINHHTRGVVVKYSWYVFPWEGICGI